MYENYYLKKNMCVELYNKKFDVYIAFFYHF